MPEVANVFYLNGEAVLLYLRIKKESIFTKGNFTRRNRLIGLSYMLVIFLNQTQNSQMQAMQFL